MGKRPLLAQALIVFAWIPSVAPGCRCSQEPDVLSYEQACEEIGFALANRTVTCGESGERGNAAFDEFTASFSCSEAGVPSDAGPDAGGSYAPILDCVESMLSVPCELLVAPDGSLQGALESSAACIAALGLVPRYDAGTEPCPLPGEQRCQGVCVNPKTSPDHCGECDHACPSDPNLGFTSECVEGACLLICSGTTLDCDGDPSNGCEVDWMEDVNNCLGCGRVCPPPTKPGQMARCRGAVCDAVCDDVHYDCDGQSENGCEVALDNRNCYACGVDCTLDGLVVGECRSDSLACATVSECPPGTLNCDEAPDCESSQSQDACGGCSVKCPVQQNANPVCNDGGCAVECLAGFLDCNTDSTDGCEVQAAACP